jgi:hypothetical protein
MFGLCREAIRNHPIQNPTLFKVFSLLLAEWSRPSLTVPFRRVQQKWFVKRVPLEKAVDNLIPFHAAAFHSRSVRSPNQTLVELDVRVHRKKNAAPIYN